MKTITTMRMPMPRTLMIVAAAALFAWTSTHIDTNADAATLTPETQRAWAAYVAATEMRIARELSSPRGFLAQDFAQDANASGSPNTNSSAGASAAASIGAERRRALSGEVPLAEMRTLGPSGEPFPVPGGSIAHWRGTVFVPGVTLDRLLARAQHPSERGPFQPDVLALRVLARRPDALTLFIKMTRQKVVTVTYNTEHDLTYRRESPTRASSRSVATKIAEVEQTAGGERELPQTEDHGFLWRLNSYWRYEQVAGGVLVELESLSLSRDIPTGLGLIARPLVNSVARESMERTLLAFRREQTRPDLPVSAG
jgi:hypothetical protein